MIGVSGAGASTVACGSSPIGGAEVIGEVDTGWTASDVGGLVFSTTVGLLVAGGGDVVSGIGCSVPVEVPRLDPPPFVRP